MSAQIKQYPSMQSTLPTPPNEMLSGLGLKIHWNSSQLTFVNLTNVFQTALLVLGSPEADIDNSDDDTNTDMLVNVAWFDLGGNWPGTDESVTLYTANFITDAEFSSSTNINFSSSGTAANYAFTSTSATVNLAEVPPLEQIANILEFFDQSVSDGTLVGNGPGNSARGRLNALRNMIEAAGNLIVNEDIEGACQQLQDAFNRTDGQFPPPDFVAGDAASELAILIQNLRSDLACDVDSLDDELSNENFSGSTLLEKDPFDLDIDNNSTINALQVGEQIITPDPLRQCPRNQAVSVDAIYTTFPQNEKLSGLGLRIHYDSKNLSFDNFTDVFQSGLLVLGSPEVDTDNSDGDASTDMFVNVRWLDRLENWPSAGEETLYTANFITDAEFSSSTNINFSSSGTAADYGFTSTSAIIVLPTQFSPTLDADGNGTADALSDGVLIVRYLFSFTGNTLIAGAVAPDATRSTSKEIKAYLDCIGLALDIDGNGTADALSDGLLIVRYLFGFTGELLIAGAVDLGGTRTTPDDIQAYLDTLLP